MTGRHLSGLISYGVTVDPAGNVELFFFQPPDFAASCAMRPEDALDLAAGIMRLVVIIRDDPSYSIEVVRPRSPGAAIGIWRSGADQIGCAFGGMDGVETDVGMETEFAQAWAAVMTRVARVALVMRDDGGTPEGLAAAMGPLN
jgi:hypothetical protein